LEHILFFIWSKVAILATLQIYLRTRFPRFRRLAAASFFRFAPERLVPLVALTIGAINKKNKSIYFFILENLLCKFLPLRRHPWLGVLFENVIIFINFKKISFRI
jgi:hypothetical protein